MSNLKLVTLNIEGDRHFDLIRQFLKNEEADIVCLQEIFASDFPLLKQELKLNGIFAPMVNIAAPNKINIAPRGNFGVAIFSRYPISDPDYSYYEKHKEAIPLFDDENPNSTDRVLLTAKIIKDNTVFQIATTHFTWSSDGQATEFQKQSLDRLFKILDWVGECVLCGDFNAPRGGEIYARLSKSFTDNTPPGIITTLDKNLHRVKTIPDFVVDYIFTSRIYLAKNVRVIDHVSDHMAIVAGLSRI